MKRTKWFALTLVLATAAMFASACGGPNETGGGSGNQSGGSGSSGGNTQGGGAKGDEYVDYLPEKTPGGDQFDFDGNYEAPELTIDGKGDDAQWQAAPVLTTFGKKVDGEDAVTVKAYRGDSALFFLFDVKDTVLLTEGETNDDAVTRSDSIEFYLDTLADGGVRPQSDDYQINLGIHGKTRIMQGAGGQWGNWNGLIDYEVDLNGTLNDNAEATDIGYTVEVMVPYSQIMIEKEDTIAISFGQVDKFGTGASVNTDWNWYGWDWGGTLREPQTINNYVLYDKNGTLTDRDEQPRPAADMAGYVTDIETGKPVVGATASVTVGDREETATTDADGYFIFEKVDSDGRYEVTVRASGYLDGSLTYERSELRAANGGRVLKTLALTPTANLETTTLSGTVKNIVEGAVEGATVAVSGTTIKATSGEGGAFTISDVPANIGSITLLVTKTGYGDSELTIPEEQLEVGGTTALGDVNINLPWANMGTFAAKSALFAGLATQLTRTLSGILIEFDGQNRLSGHIEVYLDTKESGTDRNADPTAWCLNLNDDGSVTGAHYQSQFTAQGLVWKIAQNESEGFEGSLLIPYTYLDISPLEVFGIEFGQWSTSAKDWDGWTSCPVGTAPVAENPTTWMRVGARNNLYRATNNDTMVVLYGKTQEGVYVSAGGAGVVAGQDGVWLLQIKLTTEEVVVTYSKQGYVTKKTTIAANYFGSHDSWAEEGVVELEQQFITLSGEVSDSYTKAGIAGASVTIIGLDKTVTTGADGMYRFENVPTLADIVVRFSAENYAASEETIPAAELAKGDKTVNKELVSTSDVVYVTLKGKISNVNGAVAGALVSVEGNGELSATTLEDGSFSIAQFPGIDCKLLIQKKGYLPLEVTLRGESFVRGMTEFDLGTLDMWLEYAKLNGLIADLSDNYSAFKGSFTRSAVGFEFRFEGKRAFTGRLELFADTKTSAGDGARDLTDYLFNLNANGTITIVNWGEGEKNEAVPKAMKLKITDVDTAPVVEFTLPYAFFGQKNSQMGITSTEVIGISAGQWSETASGWDGWDDFAHFGANNAAFVKPEMPQDYIRLGAHNEVYSKADNEPLDLSSYEIEFATGENTDSEAGTRPVAEADYFYAKVLSRDDTGVTFSFLTTGDFGMERNEREMVLIYFDTGVTGEKRQGVNDWPEVDYLIKIASDGTVYGSNGEGKPKGAAWWSATDADKTGETVTIKRENGVCTFEYKITYERLGIGQNDVFGIAMREASHKAGDHHLYDPWYDCYFGGNRIDAAMTGQYIRVKADGTLVTAGSNAEVK